jgi:hypothetical protein
MHFLSGRMGDGRGSTRPISLENRESVPCASRLRRNGGKLGAAVSSKVVNRHRVPFLLFKPPILRPVQWFAAAQLRLKAISKRHEPSRAGPATPGLGRMSISG